MFIPMVRTILRGVLMLGNRSALKTSKNTKLTIHFIIYNSLGTKFIKWSNTLKQFVGKLPMNCLIVLDHFVGLARKGIIFSLKLDKVSKIIK